MGAHDNKVAVDSDRVAKLIAGGGIGGVEFLD
jgi:hypothetical protein